MLNVWRCVIVSIFLMAPVAAYGNGWGSGQNYVPVIREAVATDAAGNTVVLSAGTPVYVKEGTGDPVTWLRWDEKPRERRVHIDRDALPAVLEGSRSYQRGAFSESAALLAAEAAAESHALVRQWKYILAAHSHLLADFSNLEKAVMLYRSAADGSSKHFRSNAQYFVFRALLNQQEYEEAPAAYSELQRLSKDNTIPANLLFNTYPEDSPLTAWSLRGVPDVADGSMILDAFILAKSHFDDREKLQDVGERAEVSYQLALAMEALWTVFPENVFDNLRSPEVPVQLRLTFENYPDTEGAAKAYYRYLDYQEYWDFHGEMVSWEMQQKQLMERFLSRYPESSVAPEARARLDEAVRKIEEHGASPESGEANVVD